MPDITRIIRFGFVGASVAVIYIVLYMGFLALGWLQPFANAAAFLLAVAVQYVAQAGFTFRARLGDGGQVVRFGWMIGCGLLTSAIITGLLAPVKGISPAMAALIVACVLPVQNYLLMSRWVFRPRFPSARQAQDLKT